MKGECTMNGCCRLNIENPNNVAGARSCTLGECKSDNISDVLCENLGQRCRCEFETPSRNEAREGILTRVGDGYFTLKSINTNRDIVCLTRNLIFFENRG